jgi:hypothetical protein
MKLAGEKIDHFFFPVPVLMNRKKFRAISSPSPCRLEKPKISVPKPEKDKIFRVRTIGLLQCNREEYPFLKESM